MSAIIVTPVIVSSQYVSSNTPTTVVVVYHLRHKATSLFFLYLKKEKGLTEGEGVYMMLYWWTPLFADRTFTNRAGVRGNGGRGNWNWVSTPASFSQLNIAQSFSSTQCTHCTYFCVFIYHHIGFFKYCITTTKRNLEPWNTLLSVDNGK